MQTSIEKMGDYLNLSSKAQLTVTVRGLPETFRIGTKAKGEDPAEMRPTQITIRQRPPNHPFDGGKVQANCAVFQALAR
jgi:hypothetical protein